MTKATFIVTEVGKANDLMRIGWVLVEHNIAVASGGMSGQGLSNYGVEYVAEKMRVEARTFILELENAKRHRRIYDSNRECTGCDVCNWTGWTKAEVI